jgi:flagellar protein FlgJ
MSGIPISPVATQAQIPTAIAAHDDPAKVHDAAQQFEALLLGQILEAARQGGGWLGTGQDSAGDCAMSFAGQQLALTMAQSGGFGLAGLIERGLKTGS